jgi:predicted alpha/beta hydrolase
VNHADLEWAVRSTDGHHARLRVQLPQQAQHGLLMIPAMGVAARHYDAMAGRLATRGIAVAIHEWRGIGSSSMRASRRSNWGYRELLDDDLIASLDAVCEQAPAVRWRLGGHSLGSQFAALLAAVDERACGIFIVAGGAPYWRTYPGWRRFALRGAFGFMDAAAAVNGYFPGRRTGFAGNEARGVIRDWTRTGRTGHYRVPGLGRDHEQALAQTRLPVLAIRLHDDWYVPPGSLAHLLDKMPHAAIEQYTIAREMLAGRPADHFGWMKHPAPIADLIAAWIANTSTDLARASRC